MTRSLKIIIVSTIILVVALLTGLILDTNKTGQLVTPQAKYAQGQCIILAKFCNNVGLQDLLLGKASAYQLPVTTVQTLKVEAVTTAGEMLEPIEIQPATWTNYSQPAAIAHDMQLMHISE